jgi:hypothetical protein
MSGRFPGKRRNVSPLARLILEIRSAARSIDVPAARAMAAREAASIPPTRIELRHSLKGRLAKHGRALMRELPHAEGHDLSTIAGALIAIAEALQSPELEDLDCRPPVVRSPEGVAP